MTLRIFFVLILVALPERLRRHDKLVGTVEPFDDNGEHLHKFASLLLQIPLE